MGGSKSDFTIERRGDHLLIWQLGTFDTVVEAESFIAAVNTELVSSGIRSAIFDNRQTTAPSEAVRGTLWEWVSSATHFERVALLLESAMTAISVNMSAVGKRAKNRVRAFDSMEEAEAWVRG